MIPFISFYNGDVRCDILKGNWLIAWLIDLLTQNIACG